MRKYDNEIRYSWSEPLILAKYPHFSSRFIEGIDSMLFYLDEDEYFDKQSHLKIKFNLIHGVAEKLEILFKDVSMLKINVLMDHLMAFQVLISLFWIMGREQSLNMKSSIMRMVLSFFILVRWRLYPLKRNSYFDGGWDDTFSQWIVMIDFK